MVIRACPPPQAARPGPRGLPVGATCSGDLGFPVFRWISVYGHAIVTTPVGPLGLIARGTAYSNRFPLAQRRRPSPSCGRVGSHVSSFRGLLDVHSRYGLPARRATIIARCLEGSGGFVTSTAAPIATGRSDPDAGWELHPLKIHDFSRRTVTSEL